MKALKSRLPWFAVVLAIAIAAVVPVESSPAAGGEPAGSNLALGKKCAFSPRPNYSHCTDAGDADQLTDGKTTNDYFWTQQGTVGWSGAPLAAISVDLGRVEPIGGVSLRTAAGRADVTWPMAVYVLVSDDGKTYRRAGDLVALHEAAHGPLPDDYAIVRLEGSNLRTRGRYVQLVMVPLPGGSYLFTDEIEVLRGPDDLLAAAPEGPVVRSPREVFESARLERSLQGRFSRDIRSLRAAIDNAPLSEADRARLASEVETLAQTARLGDLAGDETFRAVLPIGEDHARLFLAQAKLWRSLGLPKLGVAAAGPWDPLDPFAVPAVGEPPLRVELMRGEYRAAAFNLANATDRPIEVRVRFSGLPGGAAPGWITVHQAEWTDTSQLVPVVSALPVAKRAGRGWAVNVHPGLVRQVWLTIHPDDVAPGEHAGRIEIEAEGLPPQSIPLAIRVWPMRFPQQTTLWLGGFSYTDNRAQYGVTAENHEAFVAHLRERFVNAPWGSAAVLRDFEFVDGRPDRVRLNTERFDRWVAEWPGARAYLVFLSVAHYSGAIETSLGGAALGSEEFDQRVGTWIRAWVEHLRSKGIAPNRLGLLIHDEPHEGSDITALLAWARAIRKAAPEVLVWEDPTYRQPQKAPPELFEACDILCPNRPMWLEHAATFEPFYRKQQEAGRTLQFYSCSGPAKLLDPYSYHRLQAWQAWQAGANGSFFWAFGDNSGSSSWNEYFTSSGPYTPLFLDATTVTPGKQMEAIRESVEDYEYFVMLRDAVAAARASGRGGAATDRAESLLKTGPARVLEGATAESLKWHVPKDRGRADRVRLEVLAAIAELAGK
ncbi:MAG: discoidin domain-containing protein [Thermoguttaceae bacterium]|jgi:hypothetical protein